MVTIDRRTIDTVLIWLGVVVAAVLVVAGGLLTWGSNFADDYVSDELVAQNITFPPAEALEAERRDDLVRRRAGGQRCQGRGVRQLHQGSHRERRRRHDVRRARRTGAGRTFRRTYAWSTIGQIAGIAAVAAFVGRAVMLILVFAGVFHLRRMRR